MSGLTRIVALTLAVVPFAQAAWACDPCALYNASRVYQQAQSGLILSLSDQYTDFERSSRFDEPGEEGTEVTRSFRTTQLSLGYGISESFGVDVTIPFVYRSFDKLGRAGATDSESNSGIGDLVLTMNATPLRIQEATYSFVTTLYGGLKLPTGDTGSLRAEEGIEDRRLKHHPAPSAAGGRALVEGTGSVDVPFGAAVFGRSQRALFLGSAQYTIRTEGDFDYEFADDFVWEAGPGYYLASWHEQSLAGRVVFSGEHKATDRLEGELVRDSAVSNVFVGPQLLYSLGDGLTVDARIDSRISKDNTDSIVPEWRIRSGISWLF